MTQKNQSWSVDGDDTGIFIVDEQGRHFSHEEQGDPEALKRLFLMAAAPEMLSALEELHDGLTRIGYADTAAKIAPVIAKARGKQ
jgi:hypothetical protein